MTHVLRENLRVLRRARVIGEHLEDRLHIADGDALIEQVLQDFLHLADREKVGDDFVDERLVRFLEVVDEVLRLLTTEDLRRMALDDLREVRREHGDGIDNRVAVELRLLALALGDPERRQAERGLRRLDARDFLEDRARVHREVVVEHELSLGDLDALELDDVGVGLDLDVVTDADRRHDEAELERALPPDHDDAVEQVAALPLVDERDEAVADLKLHGINLQERDDVLGRGRFLFLLLYRLFLLLCWRLRRARALLERTPDEEAEHGEHAERNARQARHDGEERQHAREDEKDAVVAEELRDHVRTEVALRARARDDEARRRRDEERRNLRDEALADGQQRVLLERLHGAEVSLQHADDEAACDVDEHDDDGGDGIALDELRGTIHRTEEVRLVLDLLTPHLRLRVRDRALVEVGIDRHLFAGHRIEREASGHLSDAFRSLRDDDEVDADEDDEHDEADDRVTADNEISERRDDLAGVAVQEDEARRGDVECEAEERRHEEERREDGEVERLFVVDDRHDDEQRDRDIETDEEIEQQRRQRNDHHHDDDDDGDGDEDIAVFLYEASLAEHACRRSNR